MTKLLALSTLIMSLILLFMGEGTLIGALFVGYFTAALCCWTMTNRMSGAAFDEKKAVRQFRRGPFIRFGSLAAILALMAKISSSAFFVTIVGYFLFMFLAFGCLIASRLRKSDEN
jgi:hypothetical protein